LGVQIYKIFYSEYHLRKLFDTEKYFM